MKRVFNLLVVDESGSMSVIERQALAGINETLATVRKMQEVHADLEQRVTLITFDSTHTRFLYDNVPAAGAAALTPRDYSPCGATPLYDAVGLGIAKVDAQTGPEDKVLVTVITDGEENCSREYTLTMVKNLIEKRKGNGWTFAFIGTDNLDVKGMAAGMGIDNSLAFRQTEAETKRMFQKESNARMHFCCCLAEDMEMPDGSYFDAADGDEK